MNEIAKELGISAPALYWHFDSKQSILAAYMESALSDFVARIEAAVTSSEPSEQLRQLVHAYVMNQLEEREFQASWDRMYGFGQLLSAVSGEERSRIVGVQRRFVQRVRDILRAGCKEKIFANTDVVVTAFAIINLCEYAFTWFRRNGRLDADAVAKQYADLVLAMVQPAKAHDSPATPDSGQQR